MLPASTELPNSVAVPSVGGSRPVSIFMVVDLPQPFEPRKPKISPRSIDSVTWSTAVNLPNRQVRPCASMAIPARPGGRGGGQHAPRVHGHDPVPALRLVHVRGGDDHAHAGPAGADVVDERPELPP